MRFTRSSWTQAVTDTRMHTGKRTCRHSQTHTNTHACKHTFSHTHAHIQSQRTFRNAQGDKHTRFIIVCLLKHTPKRHTHVPPRTHAHIYTWRHMVMYGCMSTQTQITACAPTHMHSHTHTNLHTVYYLFYLVNFEL